MNEYSSMLMDALGMFAFLGAELSILFIIICAGVNLLQQYIPDSKIQDLLGASHGRGYFLAALLGAVTPFCSCSTIPMLRGLLKAKAGFGPTLTFLFASPLLNPIIIVLFVATFGFKVSVIYTCTALIISIIAGFILNQMKFEQYIISDKSSEIKTSCCNTASVQKDLKPLITDISCCNTSPIIESKSSCCGDVTTIKESPFQSLASSPSCCSASPTAEPTTSCCGDSSQGSSSCCEGTTPTGSMTFKEKVKWSFVDAWKQFKQLLPYLLIGVTLGAVVYGFVPSDFIVKYASGDSMFSVPIAAIIGIPLYIRVEALIPISSVLVGKGMGLGAVMALIIGGGGASLTEVILLKSMFKMPMIIAFLVVILGMAIICGYLFQVII